MQAQRRSQQVEGWRGDDVAVHSVHTRSRQRSGRKAGGRGSVSMRWPLPSDRGERELLPLSPLCLLISLPSYNIKTVPLCACILGNLPPTMEIALASAWEEDGAMERESEEGERDTEGDGWRGGREGGRT